MNRLTRYRLACICLGIVQCWAVLYPVLVLVIAATADDPAEMGDMWWFVSLLLLKSAIGWFLWWRYFGLRLQMTLSWYLDRVDQLGTRRTLL